MKKFIALTLAIIMMCSSVFAGNISVNLNGENIEFSNQVPVIVEGRTLIPLRGVFEKLGYEISWDNKTKTANFTKGDIVVNVTVNAGTFKVNNSSVNLDVPAQIINGSMMLPLRAVGEATGLKVDWDNENKVVNLSYNLDNVESTTVKTTETTTETTTEKATETTTTAKISEADYKAYAEGYVNYTKSTAFISSYSLLIMSIIVNIEQQGTEDVDFDALINANNVCRSKVSQFTEIESNNKSLDEFKKCLDETDELINLYKRYQSTGTINSYTAKQEISKKGKALSEKFSKLSDVMETEAETYFDYIQGIDWNEEDLTDKQVKEVRAYQKKIGGILDKYLNNINISKGTKNSEVSTEIKRASTSIRKEVAAITPPDFAIGDKYIMLKGCDVLDEIANICSKNINEPVDVFISSVEVNSLLLTFEACAKSCAGDYYVAKFINN